MATRTLKARVELDGEKQYKQALSDLNQGNKVLASEMKKLQAEYKNNAESTEFLIKKGDLLQRQLLQQKDKVETLKKALQESAEKYGEADKRTQDWIVKLNNAEAAQYDLEHSIEENNRAIETQGQDMKGLGDIVEDLAGKFGVKLPEGATKALNGIKNFSAGSVIAITAIATAITGVIEGIKKLNEMTLEAASRADDLATQSMISGLSTTQYQQLQYAAPYIDVSAETITSALSKVTKAAAAGDEAFQKLGVAIYDQNGYLRDNADIFFEALEALSQYTNETERNAMAQELFGKSAQELNPLILQLDEARRLYNEALDEGYVLTEQQIAILGAVDDAHEKYNQTVQKNKDLIAVQWGPAVKEGYELLQKMIDKAGKMLIESKLVENFAALVQSTLSLIDTIGSLFDLLPSGIGPIQQLSDAVRGLAVLMATLADAANVVAGLMPWNWGSGMATTALGWNINKGQMSNLQQLKYGNSGWTYNEELGAWNAGGTQNWRGGLTWVGEAGPELVALPRGSQIYSNQESRGMGDQIININVNGIEQLDEIVRWYDSRRIRGRMA